MVHQNASLLRMSNKFAFTIYSKIKIFKTPCFAIKSAWVKYLPTIVFLWSIYHTKAAAAQTSSVSNSCTR